MARSEVDVSSGLRSGGEEWCRKVSATGGNEGMWGL